MGSHGRDAGRSRVVVIADDSRVKAPGPHETARPLLHVERRCPARVREENSANEANGATDAQRYARALEASKRIRWDIDRDVIRGRTFNFAKKFLPDSLSKLDRLGF